MTVFRPMLSVKLQLYIIYLWKDFNNIQDNTKNRSPSTSLDGIHAKRVSGSLLAVIVEQPHSFLRLSVIKLSPETLAPTDQEGAIKYAVVCISGYTISLFYL